MALYHYSKAIELNDQEAVFYSNRGLVYLKLKRYYECIIDCTASIERQASIKAYARRAAAWASLGEYFMAAEDYKRGLKFEPRNQDCLVELEKCLSCLKDEYQNKLNSLSSGSKTQNSVDIEKLKKSLANVLEDMKNVSKLKLSAIQNTK